MSPTPIDASVPAARVLVIDDETQIRRFLDISLRAQGYQVRQAATGQEGLQLGVGLALHRRCGEADLQALTV